MTVRGLCGEAELCGPLNATSFFLYASDWKKNKRTMNNIGEELSVVCAVRAQKGKKKEKKKELTPRSFSG